MDLLIRRKKMSDKEIMINEIKVYFKPKFYKMLQAMSIDMIRILFNTLNGRSAIWAKK